MLRPSEFKQAWIRKDPGTQTDYNNARYRSDKLDYAKEWVAEHIQFSNEYTELIIPQKYRMITDRAYCRLCTNWSDKISVYDELKKLGYESIAMPYKIMHRGKMALDDLNGLEGSYVAKCNHGSGWNIFFNTNTMNKEYIVNTMNDWIDKNYAYISGYEAQYEFIKPGIIIQPDMLCKDTNKDVRSTLMDYSFYCYKGKIISISLTKKLSKCIEEYIAFVDENGKALNRVIGLNDYEILDLPSGLMKNVNMMKPYVNKISSMFDFVRVDMYFVDNKVYFGETTFTPSAGYVAVFDRK